MSQLVPFIQQLVGADHEGALRWFPERAFDFYSACCPYGSGGGGGEGNNNDSGRSTALHRGFTIVISQDPSHVGGTVWDAETVLAHHLVDTYAHRGAGCGGASNDDEQRYDPLFPMAGMRVLELGSGTGLAGIAACRLGAEVHLTELPEALPLLRRNAVANLGHARVVSEEEDECGDITAIFAEAAPDKAAPTEAIHPHGRKAGERDRGRDDELASSCRVFALRWGEAWPEEPVDACGGGDGGGPYDLVLVADCVYLPELYNALHATIRAAAKPGTVVLVSSEQRRRDTSAFFAGFRGAHAAAAASKAAADSAAAAAAAAAANSGTPNIARNGGGSLTAEHLPGSDGRPLVPLVESSVFMGASADGDRDLTAEVTWLESPILNAARSASKIHVAIARFVDVGDREKR